MPCDKKPIMGKQQGGNETLYYNGLNCTKGVGQWGGGYYKIHHDPWRAVCVCVCEAALPLLTKGSIRNKKVKPQIPLESSNRKGRPSFARAASCSKRPRAGRHWAARVPQRRAGVSRAPGAAAGWVSSFWRTFKKAAALKGSQEETNSTTCRKNAKL